MGSTLTVDNIVGATTAANVKLPAGSVLQVVEGSKTAVYASTSTSFNNTGVEVTITPKYSSSKILISVTLNGVYRATTSDYIVLHIYKNDSNHHSFTTNSGQNSDIDSESVATCYLDSPSTTSATKYSVYQRSGNGGNCGINMYGVGGAGSTRSTITLTEISV